MKEHIMRLLPGDDLYQSIDNYCKKYDIKAGYVGTCVGSLSRVKFRKGLSRVSIELFGHYEVVSCVGTVSKLGHHIHIAVSNEEFNVQGGHIVLGCIVKSTAEIVIVELENHELTRTKGELSGHKELEIKSLDQSCKSD